MTSADDRPGELTDAELDHLLEAANDELLDHIKATADPNGTLTAIMAGNSLEAIRPATAATPATQPVSSARAAALIRARARSFTLEGSLASARDLAHSRPSARDHYRDRAITRYLASARDLASELASEFASDHELASARDLASELASDLDRDCNLDRELDRMFDDPASGRGLARELDLELNRHLERGLDLVLALARDLRSRQIDASGADLSQLGIVRQLDVLDGVTWTRETSWPPGIASQVAEHSEEIRPGVYQVRLGNTRDRSALISV